MKSNLLFLFTFVIVISTSLSANDSVSASHPDSLQKVKTLFFKTSPTQFLGYRLPLIFEKGYGGYFSTELGVGPTSGRQGFHLNLSNLVERTDVEKRKIGIHIQASQKFFFKKEHFRGHHIGVFYRYGYFPTITEGESTYLEKNHLYATYGYKQYNGPLLFEYWIGIGSANRKERYHETIYSFSGERSQFIVIDYWLPSIAIGINVGLKLN